MAEIAPFRGLLYTPAAGDPARLLAPPYDVISDEERRKLEALDPHNCVRLILPQPTLSTSASTADASDSRYAAAASTLRSWIDEGVIARDTLPAIYRYHQRFPVFGQSVTRAGWIARVRLHRFDEGVILPHERTLSGPKADRLKLMRATRAHFSQIFGLYNDPSRTTDRYFEEVEREDPALEATTTDGVTQILWRLTDPGSIRRLARFMAEQKVYIADGHHRYETMLALRDELRSEVVHLPGAVPGTSNSAVEFGTMFFCNMDDPGLLVFPTHRVLHGLAHFDRAELLRRAERCFFVREVPAPQHAEASRALREDLLAESHAGPAFALATPGSATIAILRVRPDLDDAAAAALPPSPALRGLDVTVLHSLVLEHLLGIDRGAQEKQTNLRYLKDWDQALAERNAPSVQAVFLMNPTRVSQVKAVADAGEVMPQKSTFFYPKIASGLVMNPIVASESVDPVQG